MASGNGGSPHDLDLKTQVGRQMVGTVALPGVGGTPESYETMIFPCDLHGEVLSHAELYRDRYTTREQAENGHQHVVDALASDDLLPFRVRDILPRSHD